MDDLFASEDDPLPKSSNNKKDDIFGGGGGLDNDDGGDIFGLSKKQPNKSKERKLNFGGAGNDQSEVS